MSDSKIVNTISVQQVLYNHIARMVVAENGQDSWSAAGKDRDIANLLESYQPTVPRDGTVNSIAYTSKRNGQRVRIKTSRFLSRRLGLNTGFISEAGLHKLTDEINAKLFQDLRVELVKGSQITKNYENKVGSSSCMTGLDACYTRLYEMNPDRFQQLVMYHNNDSGRAIVHKLDNGSFLLDRIYASSGYIAEKMREYGRKQGWQIRGEIKDFSVCIVSNLKYINGQVPYQDTLQYYRIEDKRLTIFHRWYSSICDGILNSTTGQINEGIRCYCCEGYFDEDNVIYIDDNYYCESCVDKYYTCCEDCGDYIHNDDICLIEDKGFCVCDSCLRDNYTQCSVCNGWFKDDWVQVEDTGDYVCTSCADKEFTQCSSCSDYFSKKYVKVEDKDNCYVCRECANDNYDQCAVCGKYFSELTETSLLEHILVCEDCGGNK